jgi:hypothetical protein
MNTWRGLSAKHSCAPWTVFFVLSHHNLGVKSADCAYKPELFLKIFLEFLVLDLHVNHAVAGQLGGWG